MYTPKILIVGLGKFGNIHANNLLKLQEEGLVGEIRGTDISEIARNSSKIKTHQSLEEGLQEFNPDGVWVIPNTQNHGLVIEEVADWNPKTAIFCEKPFMPGYQEGLELEKRLKEEGYDTEITGIGTPISLGYLINFSPALKRLIQEAKKDGGIEEIFIEWLKERGPRGGSAGVVEDELTHGGNASRNIARTIYPDFSDIDVITSEYKRNSDTIRRGNKSMIDNAKQIELYGPDRSDMMDPISEVRYKMIAKVGSKEIPISGFSSFANPEFKREIRVVTSKGNEVIAKFDVQGQDYLIRNGVEIYCANGTNKVLDESRAMLDWMNTGKINSAMTSVRDSVAGAKVTNEVGSGKYIRDSEYTI